MMKIQNALRNFGLGVGLALIVPSAGISGPRELSVPVEPGTGRIQPVSALFLTLTRLSLKEGRTLEGRLFGIEGEAILLRIGEETKSVSMTEIESINIMTEKNKNPYLLTGALVGGYLLSARPFNPDWSTEPPHFYQNNNFLGIVLSNIIYLGPGIGLGWLAGSLFERDSVRFDFRGRKPAAEWERLKAFIVGPERGKPKFHLTVHAGQVFGDSPRRYRDTAMSGNEYFYRSFSSFNVLRRLRLSYAIASSLEIGYTLAFLGFPGISGYQYFVDSGKSLYVVNRSSSHYATLGYKPWVKRLDPKVDFAVGAGVGAARAEFRAECSSWRSYTSLNETAVVSKTVPSALVFTEFSYFPYKHLSLGISADWAWLPSQEVPPMNFAEIPACRIRLSSASVGFTIGLHY